MKLGPHSCEYTLASGSRHCAEKIVGGGGCPGWNCCRNGKRTCYGAQDEKSHGDSDRIDVGARYGSPPRKWMADSCPLVLP